MGRAYSSSRRRHELQTGSVMGFTRGAPSHCFMSWWRCDFGEGALIETITCKPRPPAPRQEWMPLGDGGEGGVRKRWGGRQGDRETVRYKKRQKQWHEWGTRLPGSWQRDISPRWQGQNPLSMSCTLQARQRQMGGGGGGGAELRKEFVCHWLKSTKNSAAPQQYMKRPKSHRTANTTRTEEWWEIGLSIHKASSNSRNPVSAG